MTSDEQQAGDHCTSVPALGLGWRIGLGLVSLLVGAGIWLPSVHWLFIPREGEFRSAAGLSPVSRKLAERHLRLWTDPELKKRELDQMRLSNPEWDFMGRTFLVLSLANMCLRDPEGKTAYLPVIDQIIADTERLLAEEGNLYFLMEYARRGRFVQKPPRSVFIDGEVALMIASRRFVEEKDYAEPLSARVECMVQRMKASPVLSCESYPDECWMFCNIVAAATIKMHDVLDGTDHTAFLREWLATVKEKLTHPETGLLWSSYGYAGYPIDGPEGSTIWMAAHCLQIVDEAFAEDQYRRACRELRASWLGFAWAREWPESWKGPADVDSGPIIPFFEISAGSSGMAFLGAASFHDDAYYNALVTTLKFSALPVERDGQLKFCASNQVGDAVLLYSTVMGPLWEEVRRRDRAREVL